MHGNALELLAPPPPSSWTGAASWDGLTSLKLMGNELRALPAELGRMRSLRMLGVAGNRLEALPDAVRQLGRLETVLAGGAKKRTPCPRQLFVAS